MKYVLFPFTFVYIVLCIEFEYQIGDIDNVEEVSNHNYAEIVVVSKLHMVGICALFVIHIPKLVTLC